MSLDMKFEAAQGNGFALATNNATLIDKWSKSAPTAQATMNLKAGQSYSFAAAYYDLTGSADNFMLEWSGDKR